jgi:hypothetical protein
MWAGKYLSIFAFSRRHLLCSFMALFFILLCFIISTAFLAFHIFVLSPIVATLCLEGRGAQYVGWGLLLLEHQEAASSSFYLELTNCSLKS